MKKIAERCGAVLIIGACIAISAGAFSHATAASVWGIATPAVFPAGAQAPSPWTGIASVSCASVGNCTAVGGYVANNQSDSYPFTMTSTNGVWGTAQTAVFPNGAHYSPAEGDFTKVSCASPGHCTAVGKFLNAAGTAQPFTMTSTNGTWGNAAPVVFPNTAPFQSRTPSDRLLDVVCSSAGNCTAVGYFRNTNSTDSPFVMTSINGTWGTPIAITLPNNGLWGVLTSLSCASAGNCTSAGYVALSGGAYEAMTASSTNGTWGTATRAIFANGLQNATPDAGFMSVSCGSVGNCTAVGYVYNAAGYYEAMTMSSTNGTWANAQPATFANGVQSTQPAAGFESVVCVTAGNCTAVGNFSNANNRTTPMTMTSTNGTWANAQPATFANGVQSSTPNAWFSAVSCASVGNCTAVGQFRNAANGREVFTTTSTNGTWGIAIPAVFANGVQHSDPEAYFTSVSCPTADSCVAAGRFKDPTAGSLAMTMTSSAVVNNPTTTSTTAAPSTTSTTTAPLANQSPTTSTTLPAPTLAIVKALPKASTPIVANTSLATGEAITVSFGGFKSFEYVQLIVASTPKVIGSGYANAQGVVTITGSLPASLASGTHTLAVYAPASGIGFSQAIAVSNLKLPATGLGDQSLLMAGALFLLLGGLLLGRRKMI